MAKCYKQIDGYKSIVSHCSSALELATDDVSLMTLKAQAYESLEKYELALETFQAARTLAPWNQTVVEGMNRVRSVVKASESGETAKRQKEAEEAKGQGNVAFREGKLEKAIECY